MLKLGSPTDREKFSAFVRFTVDILKIIDPVMQVYSRCNAGGNNHCYNSKSTKNTKQKKRS